MRKYRPLLLTAAFSTLFLSITLHTQDAQNQRGRPEPPMAGIHWARGVKHAKPGGGSPNLIYHGGPVMSTPSTITPIFWGTGWSADPQNKIGWMDTFYGGFSKSSYAGTNSEYTQTGGAHVSTTVNVSAGIVDPTESAKNGNQTSPILAEVCKVIAQPVANGYYPVYIDRPRGHAQFCAWHSAGTCGGVTVQFAFFFNLDGDAGCYPESTSTAYSQGVAALGNVSGHELSEMVTDPHLNAWYDSSGAENADKCAWTFGHPLLTFSNHSDWKVQGNWSNAAFNTNSGYTKGGCVDGAK